MASPLQQRIQSHLEDRARRDLYRRRRTLDSPQGARVTVEGREWLNFSSNDYLGLANDPQIVAAFQQGAQRWGVGAGASHLVTGHTRVHHELEEALAEFTGRERALVFSSGYAANQGAINGLLSSGDAVFQDRLNHASLLDGGWLSRAASHWYHHADPADLQQQLLTQSPTDGLSLIVSDGVFSMDGDQCPLDDLIRVARTHKAALMIDDAHGFGCLGASGEGTVSPSHYNSNDVPVLMATLGKSLGTAGAFVAGDNDLIEFLIQRARHYIYTTAIPPAVAAASLTSLHLVQTQPWRRQQLQELIDYFKQGAAQLALPLLPSNTAIQPIVIGCATKALALSRYLEERGIGVTAIRPPTVPDNTARLRITITAKHQKADIDYLLDTLTDGLKGLNADEASTPVYHRHGHGSR